MATDMEIRPLQDEDIPAVMRLSTQAGWNQVPADWRRLLDLNPDSCFAGWVDDELVATATLVTYEERVGWIGMVLVEESHRRQGYGMQIFERTLEAALDRNIPMIGLDATDAGRSVYRQADFVDVAPIERWVGELEPGSIAGDNGTVVSDPSLTDVLALDQRACGVDRSNLLTQLYEQENVTTFLVSDSAEDENRGYAIVRPGRNAVQAGPIVALDMETLSRLLKVTGKKLDNPRIVIDVLGGDEATDILTDANLACQRKLTRMTYQTAREALLGEHVVAAAGLELG